MLFHAVLVILLGALGFSAGIGWLDIVLLPLLAIFIVITGFVWWNRQKTPSTDIDPDMP